MPYDINEIERSFKKLKIQYENGSIRYNDYIIAVDSLRVQDENGIYWQIRADDGKWVRWDGSTWIPGDPFHGTPPPSSQQDLLKASHKPDSSQTRAEQVISPVPYPTQTDPGQAYRALRRDYENGTISYLDFTNRARELGFQDTGGQRRQIDSAKGTISKTSSDSLEKAVPPATQVPVVNVPPVQIPKRAKDVPPPEPESTPRNIGEFRSRLIDFKTFKEMKKELPVAQRPQSWWDYLSIVGGVIVAIIWIFYSGIRSLNEGFDILTPILMVGIPVFLVWFRADIDKYLIPVQPFRKKFPKLVLVGIGIVIPFLTAFILSTLLSVQNYPLIHWNTIIGTALAYIISRDPVLAKGYTPPRALPVKIPLFLILCLSLLIRIVNGDDCLTDPMNAQDCLRTPGYSIAVAGSFDTALSVIVNAPAVIRNVIPGQGVETSAEIPPGSLNELEDEYRRLLDTIATEKANRDAWAREGKDSGRDGMISILEEEAERRRRELEELGNVPDYEGRVEGPIGPSGLEKGFGDLEEKVGEIESDTSVIMERDVKTQEAIENLFRLRKENYDATSGRTPYDYASMTWENIKQDFSEARDELTDINNWEALAQGFVLDTGKELIQHPVDSFVKTVKTTGLIVEDMVKHPINTAVMVTTGIDMKGVISATDYNKPLLSRIGMYFLSTVGAGRGLKPGVEPIEVPTPKVRPPKGVEVPTVEPGTRIVPGEIKATIPDRIKTWEKIIQKSEQDTQLFDTVRKSDGFDSGSSTARKAAQEIQGSEHAKSAINTTKDSGFIKSYNETMQKAYTETDIRVKERIAEEVLHDKGLKPGDIKTETFETTKTGAGDAQPGIRTDKVPADRDVAYSYTVEGKKTVIPPDKVQRIYNEEYYKTFHDGELPRKPDGSIDTIEVDTFANTQQQRVTGPGSTESFSLGSKGAEGDLKVIQKLKDEGKYVKPEDPEGLSLTWKEKAGNPYETANEMLKKGPSEAAENLIVDGDRQMIKNYDLLVKRNSALGENVKPLPPELDEAMKIIIDGRKRNIAPAEIDAKLQDIGLTRIDLYKKIGSQWELKW